MRPSVIGLTGKARSGKDTVANFIVASVGGYQYAFADPLRNMLAAGFGINMMDPYWATRKEEVIPALGKSPRQLMQTLGTEWGRQCVGENVWVVLAKAKLLEKGAGMVISDVRFENEAAWVRRIGGRVLHVRRETNVEVSPHASEGGVAMGEGDAIIHNNSTVEELQNQVRLFMEGQ